MQITIFFFMDIENIAIARNEIAQMASERACANRRRKKNNKKK